MKLHIAPEAPRDILDEKGELVATAYNPLNIAGPPYSNDPAAVALARQFAASGEMLAERDNLLAQTQRDAEAFKLLGESLAVASEGIAALKQKHQRDAAVIAELVAAMRGIDDNWRASDSGCFSGPEDPRALARFSPRTIRLWKTMRAALAAAESRAEAGREKV